MFVFFLKMQNIQCRYHHGFSSLMDPLVLQIRRLRLEDSSQDRDPLRLNPPLTKGWLRRWLLVRQTWDNELPTSVKSRNE
jgi:hypothetical protein